MTQQSIFDALVKLSKRDVPREAAEENLTPPPHPSDGKSARAYATQVRQHSIFDALVKLSRKNAAPEPDEEPPPRLKRRDQRSPRARARNAAHRRAVARGIPKQTKYAPKTRWPSIGRRGGAQPPPGASVLDRIVRAMEPGCWYARRDLGNLVGLTRNQALGVRIFSHGYLTRRRNPEWQRWEVPPKERLPFWLYTLTPAGRDRRCHLEPLTRNTAREQSLASL
jgi:hypothetical protein